MSRRTNHNDLSLLAAGLVTALVLFGSALGQATADADAPLKGDWAQGFWPTERMMKNFIQRSTLEIEERYGLRSDQRDYLEASSLQRWPEFFNKNRAKLQPLITRYVEMRSSPEPPTPQQMKPWADEAREMLDLFREEIHQQQMDFREILDPQQKMTFDGEMMKFNVGMQAAEKKLDDWKQGFFNPRDIGWRPSNKKQEEQLQNMPQVKPPDGAVAENPDGFIPSDGWTSWLEAFAEKYDLDDAQYRRAHSILTDLKKRVSQHYSRNHLEYNRLEQAPDDSRDADWQKKMQKLDEPIQGMFQELAEKCFSLLTPEQREKGRPATPPSGSSD